MKTTSKWTLEPWAQIDIDGQIWNASHETTTPEYENSAETFALADFDYRRAVICVNACKGLRNPEAIPESVRTLWRCIAALEANGAPNCEAVKEAKEALQMIDDHP